MDKSSSGVDRVEVDVGVFPTICGGETTEGVDGRHDEGGWGEGEVAVKQASNDTLRMMEITYKSVKALSKMRQDSKLSNWRVTSVAKELNELIKVMNSCLF